MDLLDLHPQEQSVSKIKDPFRVRGGELFPHLFKEVESRTFTGYLSGEGKFILSICSQTVSSDLQRAESFLKGFLESATNRHGFPDRLHRNGQRWICSRKFFEGESRNLHYTIVNGGFKTGRRLFRVFM